MSSGKLKASTNRVRTSISLQGNSMWANTIGLDADPQAGSNAAVEAAINAPQFGSGRVARRAAAAEAARQTGNFNSTVEDYQSLLALARSQGAVGTTNRGACKKCGQLGHLTKQCRNDQSVFFSRGDQQGAAPAGVQLEKLPGPPEPPGDDLSSLSSGLSDSSSSSSSDSSSSEERRRRKHKEKKRQHKEDKKSKKHKVQKKHKRHKSSRH